MNMRFSRCCAFAVVCVTLIPLAPGQDLRVFRKELEAKRKQMYSPGVAVAVVKEGKVVLTEGFGYKDLERKRRVTADTRFAIGSSTKAFVAMLTAMSGDEGKVQFADHPRKWYRPFKLYDKEADAKISVGDLLSHRSGLPRTDLLWAPGVLSVEEVLWAVSRARPTAKLGEKFQYQNVMYAAAGEVLRAAHGKGWDELVRERIFAPLGMDNSDTSIREMQRAPDYALGYVHSEQTGYEQLPMRDLQQIGAAGAINSSARDMARWLLLMTGKGEIGGKRLVSAERFAELLKPRITIAGDIKYGYGWMLDKWHKHDIVHHGGNIDGFSALVGFMPSKQVGFVALSNANGSPLPSAVGDLVWKHFVGVPEDAPKEVPLKEPQREVGTYRLEVAKMDFAVTLEGGKLRLKPTGQPKMDLIPIGERRFKVGPPAPDQVFLSFRPSKEDPKLTEAELEQGGMKFTLKKPASYKASIGVEELMAKVVEAAGGESAMRAVRTVRCVYTADLENQGVVIHGVIGRIAPDRFGDLANLTVLGRRIGTSHSVFDGRLAADDVDFAPLDLKFGAEAGDYRLRGRLFQELDWKKLFDTVQITGIEKVGGEEAYVLEKKPKSGNIVTDYVSTKTFRVLKRSAGSGVSAASETYEDYRQISGVWIPFKTITESPAFGRSVTLIEELQINVPIEPSLLRLLRKPA